MSSNWVVRFLVGEKMSSPSCYPLGLITFSLLTTRPLSSFVRDGVLELAVGSSLLDVVELAYCEDNC